MFQRRIPGCPHRKANKRIPAGETRPSLRRSRHPDCCRFLPAGLDRSRRFGRWCSWSSWCKCVWHLRRFGRRSRCRDCRMLHWSGQHHRRRPNCPIGKTKSKFCSARPLGTHQHHCRRFGFPWSQKRNLLLGRNPKNPIGKSSRMPLFLCRSCRRKRFGFGRNCIRSTSDRSRRNNRNRRFLKP